MNKRLMVAAVFAAGMAAGCAEGNRLNAPGRPAWIIKGAGAFSPDDKAFYGVGRVDASEMPNESLRVEAAENRARGALGRTMNSYTTSLTKDYAGNDGTVIERALRNISSAQTSGARVMDSYMDAKGTAYTLVKLDLERYKKELELSSQISSEAKEILRKRADSAFNELSQAEAQKGGPQ